MIDALPLLLGPEGYQISRSVRLRSSASAYFNRTPASASNRTTWTWSAWLKRGTFTSAQAIFATPTIGGVLYDSFGFSSDSLIYVSTDNGSTLSTQLTTTAVFRDPSAWYHIILSVDTTQATSTNRVRLYVNGVQITAFSAATYPPQNRSTSINSANEHRMGRWNASYEEIYLTEINFIDGQALTPSSFGETDAVTGVWKPKKYTGTYGTNGFYLNFSDNSSNTATTIGKDYSGNGNNWTPNNISVTAGATYDSMLDVPTQWADGGNGRGNYAVLNPLDRTPTGGVWSDGNLTFSYGTTGTENRATIGPTSGKFVAQVLVTAISGNINVGLFGNAAAQGSTSARLFYRSTGEKVVDGVVSSYGASYTTNDVIRIEADYDTGTVTFYKNNVSQGAISYTLSSGYAFAHSNGSGTTVKWNFGQQPWFNSETPTSGFKALNTLNLPTPTILKGNQYFDVALQTGNTTGRTVSGLAFQPDLVIVKNRAGSTNRRWGVIDSVRGVNKTLSTALTDAEVTSQTDLLTTFNSDGFTIGADAGLYGWNGFAESYAHFTWKEGATQGFDIVTFTGNGATRTISHSLGVAPKMMFVKSRSATGDWWVYHESIGATKTLFLSLTDAALTFSSAWNNTAPTSSVFTVGTASGLNVNGVTSVAYLFAEVAGFSRFGSYTGNGSTDGPFVFCGFRPRFVMTKRTDTTGPWQILDTARDTYNSAVAALFPNTSGAEASFTQPNGIDYLSNGFKLRNSSTDDNANGGTYIFAAFCENPFKNALAR